SGTFDAIGRPDFQGLLHLACDSLDVDIGPLRIRPFTVPHDAREPLQLRCTDGDARLGLLTDLGHVTAHVQQELAGCGTLVLECNHDEGMLMASSYPPFLKRRVGGAWGHLANSASAELARALLPQGLKQVVAAHLSEQNNTPDLARQALAQALNWPTEAIHVASPTGGSPWFVA